MYHLRLLGEPRLTDRADRPLPLGRLAAALLALLARAPDRRVGRERASALLWPDSEPATARRALRQLVFRVRADAPEAIEATRERLLLGSAVATDVDRFAQAARDDRLAEAADLYAPFLDGLVLPGCSAFEQWADGERAALLRSAADVFERLVDNSMAAGDWQAARSSAVRWLAAEPYSEQAASRAIIAAARVEGNAAALATADAFRRRLQDDLGIAPSPALEQLVLRLGADSPAPDLAGAARGAAPRRAALPAELPFVGREREYAQLAECWRRARHGQRQLVLLRGEPGIGKTRLARELTHWAASLGATVLATCAWEVEAAVPYATLAGVLRGSLRAPGLAGVEERTLTDLSRIVPALATRFAGIARPGDTAFETGALRIMDATRDLLDSLAHEAPVLLVIDDLPWADEATVANLHYAWRTLAAVPLMILATARGTAAAELRAAAGFVAAAMREPGACSVIDVGPLGRDAIHALAASTLDGSAPVDASDLEVRSGGNPLFLAELLHGGPDTPTETIRFVTLDRIAALDTSARVLLHAAAVLGRQFPLPDAGGIAGLDAAAAAAAVDGLVSRRLLRQVSYGYDFAHDVVRETVLADLGPETRRLLHRRAFEYLREGVTDVGEAGAELAGALAHHAAGAGLRDDAHRWHMHAARAAIDLFAPVEADRALARALEFADGDAQRCETWTAIAHLARVRSDFRSAAYAFHRAYETSHDAAARLALRMRMLHMGTCAGLFSSADVDALADSLRAEAERAGSATLGDLLFIEADAASRAGNLERAAERVEAAARAHRESGTPRALVRTLLLSAGIRARSGRGDALDLLHEATRVAQAHELGTELSDARIELATEQSRLGRWDDALAGFAGVVRDAAASGDFGNVPIARLNAADLHAKRGDWDAARREILELERICARFNYPHVAAATRLNSALMEWLRGDSEGACRLASEARTAAGPAGVGAVAVAAAALEALCLLSRGSVERAAALLEEVGQNAIRHATWSDDAELVAIARARLFAVRGNREGARDVLARARAAAREPYAAALLTIEQAELLAADEPDAAAAHGADALRAALALGAAPLVERARRALQLRTARPAR